MAILGLDISHWSSLAHEPVDVVAQGYDFLFWKSTQGSTTRDSTFPVTLPLTLARYGNPLFAAFHYMDESDPALQFENIALTVPKSVPVILDVEQGSLHTAQELLRHLRENGYSSPLLYLPEWYWARIGRPDLSHLPPLWASLRVNGSDYGSVLYKELPVTAWHAYGNQSVGMVQFTQRARLDNVNSQLDVSVFPGTRDQLAAMLTWTPPVEPKPILRYTVQPGDTLWKIALMTLGDSSMWDDIAKANSLSNPNRLIPGQQLVIPGWDGAFESHTDMVTYTVHTGDNLTSIADRYNVSVQALYDANRLAIGSNPNLIHAGLVLSIPRIR